MRFALFALPGPGDAVVEVAKPAVVVASQPNDFSACITLDKFRKDNIDAIIVAGWEKKIPPEIYSGLKYGAWNIHPSLLPKYRGHNPYFWTLRNGETETGVTIHQLTAELDAGPVLLQRKLAIAPHDTLGSLWHRLGRMGAEVFLEALPLIEASAPATPQVGEPSRAPRVRTKDCLLHLDFTVENALNLVRACNPFYGAVAKLDARVVKIFEARRWDASSRGPKLDLSDGAIEILVLSTEEFGICSGDKYSRVT